ncbi:hypothetical protein [Lysobacter fragariae]
MKRPASGETRLGFFTLDWKLNVSALLAVVLSVSTLMLQAWGYWQGAVVTVQPAQRLYLVTDNEAIRIGARMVYTNDGTERYNALVLSESVVMSLGENRFVQWAEERGRFAEETREGAKHAVLLDARDAAPFVVPGMQLVTHDAYFAARERSPPEKQWVDYLPRERFVQLLEQALQDRAGSVDFTFVAKTRQISGFFAGKESTLVTRCSITLDRGLINRMRADQWTSRSCRSR